jgi:hypothetical protein
MLVAESLSQATNLSREFAGLGSIRFRRRSRRSRSNLPVCDEDRLDFGGIEQVRTIGSAGGMELHPFHSSQGRHA